MRFLDPFLLKTSFICNTICNILLIDNNLFYLKSIFKQVSRYHNEFIVKMFLYENIKTMQ